MAAAARATAGYGTLQRVVVQERVIERLWISIHSDEQSASAVCEEREGSRRCEVSETSEYGRHRIKCEPGEAAASRCECREKGAPDVRRSGPATGANKVGCLDESDKMKIISIRQEFWYGFSSFVIYFFNPGNYNILNII
jgi:hypothetical protein